MMHQKEKNIQKRYDGFLQTPSLWKNNEVYDLHQFQIEPVFTKIDVDVDEKLRLGKYVERLVSFEITQNFAYQIIAENIQIQQDKRTLGELDCILLKNSKPIHLEIIYKFYLYDTSVGENEIEHFIGPNRKDSLQEKLHKLLDKQLPLLYSKECTDYLKSINLNIEKMEQKVYFKAQLFIPFSDRNIVLKLLNNNCITGFYCNVKEIQQFTECKFFIPIKIDWIVVPHKNVQWLSYVSFKEKVQEFLLKKTSPICWLKQQNGEIIKFFLVWW